MREATASSPPKGSYNYSVETIISEIVDTLDQLGLQKVHFLGESTGGIFGEALAVKHPDRLLSLTTCSTPMYLPPAAQEWLAFGHSSWPAACRELGARGWGVEGLKLLGIDQVADKAYLEWWIDQVAVPGGDGLADYAGLLAKIDARKFVGDIKVPTLILAPTKSRMAPLDGQDSQRELQARVKGSKLVSIDGAGHEIYVDRADECQKAYLEFLGALKL
jgi:pimeloyl-ACP methyl ester carboxylesterase